VTGDHHGNLREVTREIRPDWDLAAPGLRAAWEAGDQSSFHPYQRDRTETVKPPSVGAMGQSHAQGSPSAGAADSAPANHRASPVRANGAAQLSGSPDAASYLTGGE
jgi:hypothetical protein